MKKAISRLFAGILALTMLLPIGAGAVTVNDEDEIMIRVGLASSSSHNATGTLACAHLENNKGYGEGFRFGYYDEDLNFVELSATDDSVDGVAVMKTQNLTYGYDSEQGRTTYSPNVSGDIRVGCYHILLSDAYGSYRDAAEDAEILDGFVAWIDGAYQVRYGAYFTKDEALEAVEELGTGEVVGTSAYGISVVELGTDRVLFQFDDGEGSALAVLPDVTGAEDVRTWFRSYKYRGGFKYERIGGGDLTVVNVLPLEEYIKGVAPYEMGREWPLEALKTQATCARTYAMGRMGYHKSMGFDLCNSDSCQVYRGVGSDNKNYGPSEVSDQAVEETAGKVVWYEDRLAETYYSSSHGGASESISNVWGSKQSKYPYLCGVVDPYEALVDDINGYSPWEVTYTTAELTDRLQSRGYGHGTKVDSLELTYSELGNVIKAVVHWTNGQTNSFKADSIRSVFGLRSIRFTVNDTFTVDEDEIREEVVPEETDEPSQDISQDIPQDILQDIPQDIPDDILQDLFGDISQDMFTESVPEEVTDEEEEPEEDAIPEGPVLPVNGDGWMAVDQELYVITGRGDVETAASKLYSLTASGRKERLELPEEEEPEEEEPEEEQPGEAPQIDYSGTVTVSAKTYVFNGSGWGHQLGMSQYGANAMAREGFTYDEIIGHYFPGTEVVDYLEYAQ